MLIACQLLNVTGSWEPPAVFENVSLGSKILPKFFIGTLYSGREYFAECILDKSYLLLSSFLFFAAVGKAKRFNVCKPALCVIMVNLKTEYPAAWHIKSI